MFHVPELIFFVCVCVSSCRFQRRHPVVASHVTDLFSGPAFAEKVRVSRPSSSIVREDEQRSQALAEKQLQQAMLQVLQDLLSSEIARQLHASQQPLEAEDLRPADVVDESRSRQDITDLMTKSSGAAGSGNILKLLSVSLSSDESR